MVSLTAIALGVSVLTTSLLTLHDTLKQADHAQGFIRFLCSQSLPTGAQVALTCVTTAIQQRVNQKGQQLRNNTSDYINDSFLNLQNRIQQNFRKIKAGSLINLVKEEQKKIDEVEKEFQFHQNRKLKIKLDTQQNEKEEKKYLGLFQSLYSIKDSILQYYELQNSKYMASRRKKQEEALKYLYDIYREKRGLKNDKWITPFNILMLIMLCVGSFFMPKLVIALGISYFISTQMYLISDLLGRKAQTTFFQNLKFDNVFQFHLAIIAAAAGLQGYHIYKQPKYATFRQKGLSLSF